ncbi:hypothetical protein SISSUDRAFT_1054688 [Sistotremastrum suecicum HHB10207 ss-3]|uniref:Fungal-type protein kinase domain-containing protein n=1 Tax=Sistotremastrum suecicum HHB10207 ss-3 TaxID=1314776 RepID=A0A165YAA1_9AGAM|nr:hypothetical protein SISSUDRAFT_1054688 [Sistotremastrum suecicum HHB10207 ss-3]
MRIDVDHAITSCGRPVSISEHRSATLPYLSLRLLHASRNEDLVYLPHSLTDELESFLWVLLHVILMKAPSGVGTESADWLESFDIRDKKQHHMARVYIKTMILSYQDPSDLAPILEPKFAPFIQILIDLLVLTDKGNKLAQRIETVQIGNPLQEEEVVNLCKEYYKEFLDIVFAAASNPSLPQTW